MLRWKEKDGILVTCADCESVSDCDDIKEDYGICRYFQKKEEGFESPQTFADKQVGDSKK